MAGEKLTTQQKLLVLGAVLAGIVEIINATAKAMGEVEAKPATKPATETNLPSVAGEDNGKH